MTEQPIPDWETEIEIGGTRTHLIELIEEYRFTKYGLRYGILSERRNPELWNRPDAIDGRIDFLPKGGLLRLTIYPGQSLGVRLKIEAFVQESKSASDKPGPIQYGQEIEALVKQLDWEPIRPDDKAHSDVWFVYYDQMQDLKRKFTIQDVADAMNLSKSRVEALRTDYKSKRQG